MIPPLLTILLLLSVVAGQQKPADLILINGDVRTFDAKMPRAEAVAVSGGKIVAVGRNDEIRKLAGKQTQIVDAKGRLVLPGFNDSHVHFAAIGNKFSSLDVRGLTSAEAVAAKAAEYARFLPKGRWILGSGFANEFAQTEGKRLFELIAPITDSNPVLLYSADGKWAFANALALEHLNDGRSSRTENGSGERSIDGIISGLAMRQIASAVPSDHLRNWPEILETASNYAASFGVTSVQDMHSDELADVYRQLDRAGKLKTRIYDCSPMSARPKLAKLGVKAATGDAMVRTGCVKYFSEGDEAELPELRRDIAAADKAGLQVMIHAIGPRANRIVLDAFEWAAKKNGHRDRRFRVEHAQNAFSEDVPRFARGSIIPSMQPWLFSRSGPAIFGRHLRLHARLAFGSDAPMVEINPLLGIAAAVNGPDGISVEAAVRAYTAGSAYAEFQEKVKGKIKSGQMADMVILSEDIFEADPARIAGTHIVATILNGSVVYLHQAER